MQMFLLLPVAGGHILVVLPLSVYYILYCSVY